MMAKVKVKTYIRKGKRVQGYTRKKRPIGKKKIKSKEKFVQIRDEFGHVLGFEPVKKKKK
jgi:hypothetical protein